MSRGLDHVVHAVRDLDAAAALYRHLGFTVGARNDQPWGTQNHIVQFPGFFVELLDVQGHRRFEGEGFPALFVSLNAIFLQRHEGLSCLMLESRNADADMIAFRDAGIAISDVLHCAQAAAKPDGSPVRLGFSLAFARDAAAPEIGFATCQQHHPENFWKAEFQHHPNSAIAIGGVVLVAENPTDHHIFLSAFTGGRELQATSSGVAASTPRGDVQIMDPAAFRSHFGVDPPSIAAGARLAAIRFKVRERDALGAVLDRGKVEFSFHMGAVVISPDTAMGATLVFEAEGDHGGG
jgi:catechol 2,3-dioxygenase-like lactoylglutathione lyase family enzyme